MAFNSIEYLVFLSAVCALFFAVRPRYRWALLLVASYCFYASWNWKYVFLIFASSVTDYVVGIQLGRSTEDRKRRLWLLTSLVINLGLLFCFKYWDFAWQSVEWVSEALGTRLDAPELDVILPVGISFYTFQTLSYTIDVYRGVLKPEPHFGRFALYVACFPQLVAGPIERARDLLPQLRDRICRLDYARMASGCQLVLWGLFKKVAIADRVGLYVDVIYGDVHAGNSTRFLIATYLFAVQVYCDFSGYSDIAIGSAKILGYDLTRNFRRPYFAQTMSEFWRRWHITLSTWLRDYLYIPLGGNRRGMPRMYTNLMITMILSGLWHGAAWKYVIWGAFVGVLLALSHATVAARDRIYELARVPAVVKRTVRIFITFHLVCVCWVIFRANTMSDAMHVFASFVHPDWGRPPFIPVRLGIYCLIAVLVLVPIQIVQERKGSIRELLARQPAPVRWAAWYALLALTVLLGVEGGSQFVYFQF